ncbi:glycosyltransferase family 2 protein [Limosilactobacillus caviae]|uniref:Glycosyl transferase n=1 Tax=Limosilactobacillus caviae TaxID=1769424 RepID=A0ABQ2C6L9_9LACO|nr:glycosyltransferase family 2 protein [Limosilactobacillus caviae]MCD7124490.1 glycosyltransferase family 2 protein [Limosilactobacillus caviae]MRH46273.1 glycosyltransferase [Limosilactobacillus reuteri]GGI63602.1 glycosyl transferase [Limosilactobacillus caviae]
MDKLAVLIPCYNEGKTIEKVVMDCKKAIANVPNSVVYVYDNNSTDSTAELAKKAGAIVRHEYMQGKGNVIRRMFREVDAECYIMIDGDDTYPAEDIPKMAKYILDQKYDMVVGDRLSSSYFEENKRPFHGIGNKLVRGSINFFFKNDIRDIMTGYRAFSFEFVKSYPVLSRGFEIETEMSIFATVNNLAVKNYIIEYRDRPAGSESKLNTFSDGFKVLRLIFTLYRNYKPFNFYGLLALLLVILSLGFFIPNVWLPYEATGKVANMPTLVVCGFCLIAGIISFYSGLILDSIQRKERREFEFRLQELHFERKKEIK